MAEYSLIQEEEEEEGKTEVSGVNIDMRNKYTRR
jgi:hypothetical protein